MKYTNLGDTGVSVSRICLGMMTYGSKAWRDWVLEYDEARPFVELALEAGINFFDTADIYSNGASEQVLGRAIKDRGVRRVTCAAGYRLHRPVPDSSVRLSHAPG
jgi:aryl-alcohol dehydrogenase (NADP+)